jgi:hypothetical protein
MNQRRKGIDRQHNSVWLSVACKGVSGRRYSRLPGALASDLHSSFDDGWLTRLQWISVPL